MRFLMSIVAAATLIGPASADRALLLGTPMGENRVLSADVPSVDDILRKGGFNVIRADITSVGAMRAGLDRMLRQMGQDKTVIFYLDGSFVHSNTDTWLIEEGTRTVSSLADVGERGLSVSIVLEIASSVPGGAVIILGEDSPAPTNIGLSGGVGQLEIPQGVTVLRGASEAMVRFAADRLLQPKTPVASAVAAASGITASGYVSDRLELVQDSVSVTPSAPTPDAAEVERAIWEATQAQDSLEAYQGYLARYPVGEFAEDARKMVAEINSEPFRTERKAEEALGLNRDQRRQIQRHLTVLEYNPRGIDGIFGRGTRAAVKAFQQKNGFPQSTYMNPQQIERLALQAERRTAELEAEAERRRLAAERQDRAYWDATGAVGDEAGLRTYLKKYPDGLFSDAASEKLRVIEESMRAQAEARDRAAWDQAVAGNSAQTYQLYLNAFPEGSFADAAKGRLAAFTEDNSAERQQAKAEEDKLRLNSVTKMLVERRLAQLGLEPGPLDGRFDDDTRKAIRLFQRDRELNVSGYLNEGTVSRMLSDIGVTLQFK
jgi:peptidoglycan hydrolase-like protein with peptidoglycan-binding domain